MMFKIYALKEPGWKLAVQRCVAVKQVRLEQITLVVNVIKRIASNKNQDGVSRLTDASWLNRWVWKQTTFLVNVL